MMKKALIYGLSAALLLVSLTACHKPQEDQPTEPDPPQTVTTTQADVSTPEPLADPKPEPPEQSPASPEQESDTIPAAPDEVEDTEPPEETAPEKTAPAEQAEQPLEATPPTTEPVVQQPSGGNTQGKPSGQTQQQQPTQQPTQQQTPQGGDTTQTQQPQQSSTSQQNKDGWNQAFYETLTPEQQETYKNLPDASYRNMMQQDVEKTRQLEAEGWTVNWGTPTEEQLEEAWGNMTFGQ